MTIPAYAYMRDGDGDGTVCELRGRAPLNPALTRELTQHGIEPASRRAEE